MTAERPRTFATLFLVAVLAAAATFVAVDRKPAPAVGPQASQSELNALVEQLRELNRSLTANAASAERAVDSPETPATRTPVDGSSGGDRLDRLIDGIDGLLEHLRAQPPAGTVAHRNSIAPHIRDRGERWGRIENLFRQHAADPHLARRSVLFLTAREVVERFGIPTESGSGKGNMWMAYKRVDADGKLISNLFFSFADGIVMFYEVQTQ